MRPGFPAVETALREERFSGADLDLGLRPWPGDEDIGILKEINPAREAHRGKIAVSPCHKGRILKEIIPAREARRENFAIST